ncbi:MAG: cation:proton antiporter [Candidatus Doudnabacteria bacterium CG10_big_fil_rev_8_21_14_0_10_42_18]|uniref:Cation:proton antiporter n=1 Tax=Candidatus Doudnabacteria bacterium CG10_big_fil_rev_8_21_14_0_10_42_18 TaxID=1974552 RepID=A0A2H0VD75_9BACT|nr:MAG: cation:proton antiporter [Candidatus Doudnabacteria bacterium CG10_big_fil_rev_8_21_14_0_10_42_18]
MTLLWIAVILVAAKLSSLIERYGQPSVLGELIVGVILGNLALVGIHIFEPIKSDVFIPFLAELGVIVLLFQVGLESNIHEMKKVGARAFLVAVVGVVLPSVLGTYLVGPWLLPGLSNNAYLFLGAALTATSVGITARVFKDLGKLKTSEAKIVLGAAVIDDVLGLIILAVVSAIVALGTVSGGDVAIIVGKAVAFLAGSIIVGHFAAPLLGKWLSKVHTGVAMKFTLALAFALVYSFVAGEIGLAPIVGAFAAGLVLDPVHFKRFKKPKVAEELERKCAHLSEADRKSIMEFSEEHSHRHVEDLIEPLAHFLVPIFFVVTGMAVNLETLFDTKILLVALGITLAAFVGKYVAGFVAGKVNKHIVGFGMVPRGEVGLIFATIGKGLGVVSDEVFSIIVIMVIFTTLLTPPILSHLLKKHKTN